MPRNLIIDCDPGVDDAIALLLTFASPELHLIGISTVAGNVPLAQTQKNARQICQLAGRIYVPVYAGCSRPILRPLITAGDIHGTTGLGGLTLPEPQMPVQPRHSVDFLIETLMGSVDPVTVATLGPLTNLAIAFLKEPRIALKIDELVMMGGAISQGNITPSAEFNFYVDPHAAQVIFSSGIKLTMISLDITHTVLTTPERLSTIRTIGTPVCATAAELLSYYGIEESKRKGMAGSPLHDPCVIAYLIQPELFTFKSLFVEVETMSNLTMGRTVVDLWGTTHRAPNANVVMSIDTEGFYQLLTKRLASL
jgi:purine nucleosidase